jgi:diadenylate cyclase
MNIFDAFIPVLEIGVIAIILNYLLSFFWNTKSMDLLVGLLAFFIVFAISSVLHLPVLSTLMTTLMNVAAVGLIIIFQPEIRVALSKLKLRGKKFPEVTEFDTFLEQLTNSTYSLARKGLGALIALENTDKLDEFSQKAVVLNAKFSSALLESIFCNAAPLHDGAVIIRDLTIVAAAVIFPLADESVVPHKLTGTRHRAALGLSQATDAVIIVISETTGEVSLVRKSEISYNVKSSKFKGVIHSNFTPLDPKPKSKKQLLKEWMGV